MFLNSLLTIALATLSLAETPPGFLLGNVTSHLDVYFGNTWVSSGQSLAKSVTANVPTIGTATALEGTYIYVMLDVDVPASFANLPAGQRGLVLHALLSGYKPSSTVKNGTHVLTTTDTGPCTYMAPAPPAETPVHPHKYVEVLYKEPTGFTVPASYKSSMSSRIQFNITQFVADTGMGTPVAANWFTITG